jgi:hypothetical protein
MKLGLLGPAEGDVAALGRAAEFLLNSVKVTRAVYLASDGGLDRAVTAWAKNLVGDDPSDEAMWRRAAKVAASGNSAQIDHFIATERARRKLRNLETLCGSRKRSIEMLADRVAILLYDKADLDEDDISAAHVFLFGRCKEPIAKRVGARWFVSPGTIGPKSGIGVIDDTDDDLWLTFYSAKGEPIQKECLATERTTKMRIQGT